MALVKRLHRVASGRGASAACHVRMFGWRNVLVCISRPLCVCRSTDDKKSPWNGTLSLKCSVIAPVVIPNYMVMCLRGDTSIHHHQIHRDILYYYGISAVSFRPVQTEDVKTLVVTSHWCKVLRTCSEVVN